MFVRKHGLGCVTIMQHIKCLSCAFWIYCWSLMYDPLHAALGLVW